MMELEHRVIKLELRVDDHAEDLKRLSDISESLKKSLQVIEKTLAQIKWIAIGIICAYAWQTLGFEKIVKAFL
jgi:hypothetical protein